MNKKLEDVYIFLLERTVRQMRKHKQVLFKKEGLELNSDHWVIIKRVHETPGVNQREVAQSTFKDPASVTRSIDLLEKDEILERKPIEGDRRSYALYLKPKGTALVNKVIPVAIDFRAKGIEGVSDKDFETFKKVLNKIYENFS